MTNKRILIIDDEKLVSDTFCRALRVLGGYDVTTFNDIEGVYKHLEENERYDLILLDMMMEKTDGLDILLKFKEDEGKYNVENVPIIILSNLSSEKVKENAEKLGVADYLVKTEYPAKELVEKINEILGVEMA